MLAVNKYTKKYISECQVRMDAQLAAYAALASKAGAKAAESFSPLFFNHLALVLDAYFVHRTRGLEGKDGNPLNEVRMLCSSILQNGGVANSGRPVDHHQDPEEQQDENAPHIHPPLRRHDAQPELVDALGIAVEIFVHDMRGVIQLLVRSPRCWTR